MTRKLVYTNPSGGVLTVDGVNMLITNITGLGTPDTDLQQQKAPYQDGTTYIDALLGNRQVVVEIAILKPNKFADIDTIRRELVNKLNPKLGPGEMIYTTEGGSQYKLFCIPTGSPNIPNKDFREPFLRCLLTFTANDPHWYEITDEVVSIPGASLSSPETVNGSQIQDFSMVQMSNGNIIASYITVPAQSLAIREYSGSWGSETIVNVASSSSPSIIQKNNGDLVIAYIRSSDSYPVYRVYTGSWGAESIISSAPAFYVKIKQRGNGNLYAVIQNTSQQLKYTELSGSWTAISDIGGTSLIGEYDTYENDSGNILVAYPRLSDNFLVLKQLTVSTWGSESVINATASRYVSLAVSGGVFSAFYYDGSTIKLREFTGFWGSEINTNIASITNPKVFEISGSKVIVGYMDGGDSDKLKALRYDYGGVTVSNDGDVVTPVIVKIFGPADNPAVRLLGTDNFVRINTALLPDDFAIIETGFGRKRVSLFVSGTFISGMQFLDIQSTFFQIPTGSSEFSVSDWDGTATAELTYTNRYVGV